MLYSDLYFHQKIARKAYFISLGIIVLSVFTLAFSRFVGEEKARASQGQVRRVEVVNLDSQGTGIFWQTKDRQVSWLIYGKRANNLNKIKYDSRDLISNQKKRANHYVELNQLDEDTDYFFRLITKKMVISRPDGKPFHFHTLVSHTANIAEKPAYGKVINQVREPMVGEIVILKTARSLPLLTFTKSTGEWLIPLTALIDKKTKDYLTLSPTEIINIEIIDEEGLTSHITVSRNNISPLSEVTVLGKDYSLVKTNENVLSASDAYKTNGSSLPIEKIRIIYPKKNSIIPNSFPLIKGTALPLQEVVITIKAKSTYTTRVRANKTGVWFLMTPINLEPGRYQLSIKTNNGKGKAVIKEREFVIAKSGEQVLGEATGSANIISPTPTIFLPSPTNSPSHNGRTITVSPQSTSKTPISGFDVSKLSIVSASLITLGLGLFLVF